jgi:integrase
VGKPQLILLLSFDPNGEDVKTVQELLRHANSTVTMILYAQAIMDIKRKRKAAW